ncbi:PAS domain S-box protein [Halogranum rubrum]|uniref:PAS domain S-box protein n=1 Tax=Halogranum salarium B-1 TaxID=1210908 RepID=J3EUJ6_9EURY|nr:PAS domain S-box protein [Halogranum salarium]EJN58077.1 hypothetical protein HSB1_34940 [Halogranum salarium B-1]
MDGGTNHTETDDVESLAGVFAASPLELGDDVEAVETFVQTLVASVPDGVLTVDEVGTIVFVNPAMARLVGYCPAELVGSSLRAVLPDRLAQPFERHIDPEDRGGEWDEVDSYVQHKAGHDVPVSIRVAEHTYDGKHLLTGLFTDRSERLEREHELGERSEEERQYQSLVEAVETEAIFRLDPDGHVETWNQGAVAITGYDRDEIRGRHVSALYPESAVEAGVPDEALATAAAEGTVDAEGWRRRSDGTRFWASVTLTAIRDADGELTGFAKVVHDRTDSRRAESRQQLLTDVSRVVAESETAEDGLREALSTLCAQTSLDGGEAWLSTPASESTTSLEHAATVNADTYGAPKSKSKSKSTPRFGDFAERVRASGDAAWLAETPSTASTASTRESRPTAFGVPIESDGDVVAVVVVTLADETDGTTALGVSEREEVQATVGVAVSSLGAMVERKRVETDLERERAFLDQLLETSPVGIAVAAPNGTVTRVNHHTEELFGLSADEILGRQYVELADHVFDDERDPLTADTFPITRVFERGEPVFDYEFGITRFDGTHRWLSVSAAPVRTANGDVEQVVAAIRDVTERKRYQQELERRLSQQQVITDLGQIALDRTDVDGLFDETVAAVRETLDTDTCLVFDDERHVRADTGWLASVDEDGVSLDGTTLDTQVGYVLQTGEPLVVTGAWGWPAPPTVEDSARPNGPDDTATITTGITVPIGAGDHVHGVLGAYTADPHTFSEHDRTFVQTVATLLAAAIERETIDRKLRAFREAVEQAGHSIYLTDVEGTIEYVNPAFERMTGYEAAEAVGENPRLLQSGVHPEAFYADLWDTILGGDVWHGEVTNERRSGEQFTVNQTIAPVVDDAGDIERFVAVNADITAQKERERTLERQRRSLERVREVTESLRPLNRALARASTRAEIEQAVCEQLSTSGAYRTAWYGSYNPAVHRITPSTWCGSGLDDREELVEVDAEQWEPLCQAVETGDVHADVTLDAEHGLEPWPSAGPKPGVETAAVIPIVFDGTVYGVVGVYSARQNAFDEYERALLGELGERVGHALNAAKNKQLLHTDTAVELEFRTRAPDAACTTVSAALDCRLTLNAMIPTSENKFVGYLGVDGAKPRTVRDRLTEESSVQTARVVHECGTVGTIEFVVDASPATTLINYGATIRSAVTEDGVETIRAEVAPETDIHEIIDGMQATYSDTTFVAKRTIDRPVRELVANQQTFSETLTDRQHEVLKLAYHAGFFESPRESTGEELAVSLGISSPTFYVHVRNAQQKLLQQLFGERTPDDRRR